MTTYHDAAEYFPTDHLYIRSPAETKADYEQAVADARLAYDRSEDSAAAQYAVRAGLGPFITTLNPSTFDKAPAEACSLQVLGGRFVPGSKVHVGIEERTTTFNSNSELTATFDAPDTTSMVDVVVVNGEQISNVLRLLFNITEPLETPNDTWKKTGIVVWLQQNGVDIEDEALMHLSKAELLELVENLLSPEGTE